MIAILLILFSASSPALYLQLAIRLLMQHVK
jgi:hypothetical protein